MHYFIFKKYPHRLKTCNVTESGRNYYLTKCPWSTGHIWKATNHVGHDRLAGEIYSVLQFLGVESIGWSRNPYCTHSTGSRTRSVGKLSERWVKLSPMCNCETAYRQTKSLALIQQVPDYVFNLKHGNSPLRTASSYWNMVWKCLHLSSFSPAV